MTDKLTEIVIIMDRSGSMGSIRTDMEGGLRALIEEQRQVPGRCLVSLFQFDTEFTKVFEGMDIQKIEPQMLQLIPRGSTALNDAVVKSLAAVETRHNTMAVEERPELVLVALITDGHENASKEATRESARKAIKDAGDRGWKFTYLAATAEGFEEGVFLTTGAVGCTMDSYVPTAEGVRDTYAHTSRTFTTSRVGGVKKP